MSEEEKKARISAAEMHTSDKREKLAAAWQALAALSEKERKLVLRAVKSGNPDPVNRHVAQYRDDLYRNLGL